MNMSKTAAISKARREVTVCRFGRDYVVHTWDDRARATRISHAMPYTNAMTTAAAAKLTAALFHMGWNHEDATHVAYNWQPGTRWEALVKEDN
jgi:hypothetical protein